MRKNDQTNAPKVKSEQEDDPIYRKRPTPRKEKINHWLIFGLVMPALALLFMLYFSKVGHALIQSSETPSETIAPPPSPALPAAPAPAVVAAADPDVVGPALPADAVAVDNPMAPLSEVSYPNMEEKITYVAGGTAGARRSVLRQGVLDFVRQAGASAGLNGTFFADASLTGTDNLLIGPSLSDDESHLLLGPYDRRPNLTGRPLILLSAKHTVLLPYDPTAMDNEATLRSYLPEMKSAFLAGVWLVHGGVAADRDTIMSFHVKDAMDPRRRAFFGVMPDGRPLVGAAGASVTSRQLARGLQEIGVQEAVLLDSGFSTSLILGRHILVTGHSTPKIPSRPVPQALVLYGTPSVETAKLMAAPAQPQDPLSTPEPMIRHRHHRRRFRLLT